MAEELYDTGTRLRILERWLPLAQETNLTEGWGYDGPTLQALILLALPALTEACSTADARAILRSMHRVREDCQP